MASEFLDTYGSGDDLLNRIGDALLRERPLHAKDRPANRNQNEKRQAYPGQTFEPLPRSLVDLVHFSR